MVIFGGMSASSSHYEILKLRRDATPEQIQSAYRNLSRIYHPDMSPGNPKANETMALINVSYEILSDPLRRAEYDRLLEQQRPAAAVTEGPPVYSADVAEPSPYFNPPPDEEETGKTPSTGRSYRSRRIQEEAEQADANRAFLVHFGRRLLIIGFIIGFLIFAVIETSRDHDDGRPGSSWRIVRALSHVFRGW
ncbi:MAG: DnaJ domain-containing protein [Alphaproteobacteria bacterium]